MKKTNSECMVCPGSPFFIVKLRLNSKTEIKQVILLPIAINLRARI